MSSGWWELIFLMLLMKIPMVYLCVVVWWAIKAEPRPEEGAARLAELSPDLPPRLANRFRVRPRRPRPGPHGSPVRRSEPRMAPAARRELPRP